MGVTLVSRCELGIGAMKVICRSEVGVEDSLERASSPSGAPPSSGLRTLLFCPFKFEIVIYILTFV